MEPNDIRVIGLLSGGLDSSLALTWMHGLGYDVVVYHFANGFHSAVHTGQGKPLALETAERLGVGIKVIDNSNELLQVVKHPDHGYGAHFNPCVDCRILMFRMTKARMAEEGAKFIFTGEVLGQRPMSQRRQAMELIDQAAGVEGLVVRPLCGKLLPPSKAEEQGWVRREDLKDIQGRSRKRQIALAEELGLKKYESPAGGCLLTDPGFEYRIRDEFRFGDPDIHEIQLLKVGRQFRLSECSKTILGRNAADCQVLESLLGPSDLRIEARDIPGPLATIRGQATPEAVRETAELVMRYAGADPGREQVVKVSRGDGKVVEELSVEPAGEARAQFLLVAAEGQCGGFGK